MLYIDLQLINIRTAKNAITNLILSMNEGRGESK